LALASIFQDPITHSKKWISAKDLGISGDLEMEWEQYCRDLNEAGVSLREKEDTLIWTGGDSTGRMLVKNIYSTLISIYEWPQTKRWKFKLWKWEIQLKKKLFIWLASENKILTWQVLQGKGWQGPGQCSLCKSEIEDVDHLFVHCQFIQTVWESLAIRLNRKFPWNGRTLCHFFETWMSDKECSSILVAHLCYNIWKERNQVIFE